jgi:S-adenosylmethionine uptake transporter
VIAAVPAALAWVTPTGAQLGLLAILGAGANLLLYCLLKSFSLVGTALRVSQSLTHCLLPLSEYGTSNIYQ